MESRIAEEHHVLHTVETGPTASFTLQLATGKGKRVTWQMLIDL